MTLTLPWPPSVNHYYARNRNGGVRIGTRGRAYRTSVLATVMEAGRPRFGTARLSVSVEAHPPTRRRFDLDNLGKATLDALEHAGVYQNDGQIDHLSITRHEPQKPGKLVVTITEAT